MSGEGWGWPANSKKAHYFLKGMSLCNKWMYQGDLEQGNDYSSDNCKVCVHKLVKRRKESYERLCKKCGKHPAAVDEGDGRQLDWCRECIREAARRILPQIEVP